MTSACHLVWPTGALLGEGPFWSGQSQSLVYVDIKGRAVHRFHPASGRHETMPVDAQPSFIVPVEGDRMLLGSVDSLYLVGETALGERLATIPMARHNRTNDATVDRHGRLWFGTMDDEEARSTGALYCLQDGIIHRLGGEAVVTNGPAISADGRTLYHVDSVERRIWRYTIHAGPRLADPELFLQLGEAEGHPDGIVLDSENCLWVALWDGWGIHRYAPDGRLLQRIDVPCARVTKIAFGGPDLTTAYVTTARIGLNESDLARQPLAGGLFAFEAPAPGRLLPSVRLPE